MTVFNTYWTLSYFLMLAFVFITLYCIAGGFWFRIGRPTAIRQAVVRWVLSVLWAALGTHFFHCIW